MPSSRYYPCVPMDTSCLGRPIRLRWLSSKSSYSAQKSLYSSPCFIHRHLPSQAVIRWVFCRVPGFAFGWCASLKPFWPLALAQQAPPAIILQALRRLRGAVLFHGLRPSSIWGFPFWLLWLTGQSSRPAFGRRLTFVRWAFTTHTQKGAHQ